MPVRKIPRNYLFVTGAFSSAKSEQMLRSESLLEQDYMLLLEFDDEVAGFEEQPVSVPVPGQTRPYVPDLFVHFIPREDGTSRPPELTEVKDTGDLKKNHAKYARKFAAADKFAADRGWIFVTKTEKQIRVPRLDNVRFLRRYRNLEVDPVEVAHLIHVVKRHGGRSTSDKVLAELALSEDERARWLPVLWHGLLRKVLLTDLDAAMPVNVPIWIPKDAR